MALGTAQQKWEQETAMEARARRKSERESDHRSCYAAVDLRDKKVCRVTGVQLSVDHSDPKKSLERHHMRKPRRFYDSPEHVLTVSRWIHGRCTSNKLHLEGNANTVDPEGKFCGVTLSEMTEFGWKEVRTL